MIPGTWNQSQGTSHRSAFLCRGGRSCARSTAVRCFKSSSDDSSSKPSSTAVRLNFKIPYRVNFGQSLGLVGSGDTLGNWDPKRTVQMKWSDGDWWTVELSVAPGNTLDLEYKYVVVNQDGNVGYWKPGSNYRVTLPLVSNGNKVAKRVKVADAWDDSFKKVDVEEAEVPSTANSSSGHSNNGVAASSSKPAMAQGSPTAAATAAPPPQQQTEQQRTQTASGPAVGPATAVSPSTTSPAASPPASSPPAAAPTASQQAPAASPPPQPTGATSQAAVAAGGNAVDGPTVDGPGTATQQSNGASSSTASQPDPGRRPQAAGSFRATSPRSSTPSFAAATSIPVIHPSLLAEQGRLEDGVRNSLEDLQAQMDKHQQLREKTDDPAAPEIIVADRIVAAANNKVIAYNKTLKAVQDYSRLPPSANIAKDSAGQDNSA